MIPTNDIAKIRAKCSCIDASLTDSQVEALFLPAIYAVSQLTNWTRSDCNTMYKALRTQKEVFEIYTSNTQSSNPFSGNYSNYSFTNNYGYYNGYIPYNDFGYGYNNHNYLREWVRLENKLVDSTTITATLYAINNSGETSFVIPNASIKYSIAENSILVDKQWIEDNDINKCLCDCERYWIVITYQAGYIELPDCVIDGICFVYNYLNLKKIGGDCSTGNCTNLDKVKWDAYVKSISVGDISYSFEFPQSSLIAGFSQLDVFTLNLIHKLDNQIIIRHIGLW